MDGRQGAGMSRVERLQQIVRFPASHLANEDTIRSVPQGCLQQIPNRDCRQISLCAPRFKPNDVRSFNLKFRRVLNDNHAVAWRKECHKRVQERRLARARTAADENVLTCVDRFADLVEQSLRECPSSYELVSGEEAALKLANGQRGTA